MSNDRFTRIYTTLVVTSFAADILGIIFISKFLSNTVRWDSLSAIEIAHSLTYGILPVIAWAETYMIYVIMKTLIYPEKPVVATISYNLLPDEGAQTPP